MAATYDELARRAHRVSVKHNSRDPGPNDFGRFFHKHKNAHAGSRTRVTSMGGLYDTATLHALANHTPS